MKYASNQIDLFAPAMETGADLSPCGQYRFTLWRIWDSRKPVAMIVGLNPSTADASKDDPTITRCIGFMKREGFGGFYMLNLFSLRATDPKMMKAHPWPNPVGFENNVWLRDMARQADKVIFAWGVDGDHLDRDKEVLALLPNAFCFGLTKEGHPRHPLFLAADTPIIPFSYKV